MNKNARRPAALNLIRRIAAGLGALAASLAAAASPTIVSFSIDGPDQVNPRTQLSVTYTVTAHYSDGTTALADPANGYLASSDSSVFPGPVDNGGLAASRFVAGGLGTVTLTFHPYANPDGVLPSATKQVTIADGADVSGDVAFECASEPAGPWQQYYPSALYLGQAADLIALCNGQALVANASLNRIQAIDTTSGQILRNWLLRASPRNMIRIPGTRIFFAALGDGTVARLDASTGAIAYTSPWARPVWAVAAFESGQVVAVSDEYPSGSATVADATIIDVATLATRTVALNVSPAIATLTPPNLVYDIVHHTLYYSHRYVPGLARFPYDVSGGSFGQASYGARGNNTDLALSADAAHVLNVGSNFPNGGSQADALTDFSSANFPDELGYFTTEDEGGALSADFGYDDSYLLAVNSSRMLMFDRASRKVAAAWSLTAQCSSNYPSRARRSIHGRYALYMASCAAGSLPTYSAIQWVQTLDPADPLPPAMSGAFVIDGPDSTDASVSTSVVYQMTTQTPDGAIRATGALPLSASDQILAAPDPSGPFIVTGIGTVQLSYGAGSRLVRVTGGTGSTDALALDCSADASDAAIAGATARLRLAEVVDIAPLCHGQVLVASAGLRRLQAIDVASGRVLRNWLVPGTPVAMVRMPGTNTVLVSLDTDQLARVDLVTGEVVQASVPHAPQILVSYEPGQVVGIAQYFIPDWTHKTDAYLIDAAALTWSAVGWPSSLNSSSSPSARYDATQHRLYFYMPENYTITQLAYDSASSSFLPLANTGFINSNRDFGLSPDGSRLAYTNTWVGNGQLSLLDASTSPLGTVNGAYRSGSWFFAPEFRGDGQQLVSATSQNLVVFDTSTRATLGGFLLGSTPCGGVQHLRWSASGRYVFDMGACGARGFASQVQLFDWSSGGVRAAPSVSVMLAAGFPNPPLAGSNVRLDAYVLAAGIQPTGTVTFNDGGTPIAGCVTVPISNLTSCTTALSAGSHLITASYSGDALYLPGTSSPSTVNAVLPPTVSLASNRNPASPGDAVTFTASVSGAGATPTGGANFWDGVTPLCYNVPLDGTGKATCTVTTLSVGTHSVTAEYPGSTSYARATSSILTQYVQYRDPVGETNFALASNGGVASASSQYSASYPVSAVINGDATGAGWSNGGGWADGTADTYPDWVQIDFNGAQQLDKVVVYTLQDNWQSPSPPTDGMTFSQYGIVDFTVQGWDGAQWQALAVVTGNNLVKRTVTFAPFTTTKIRINVTRAMSGLSRITEIEAWGFPSTPPLAASMNVALASRAARAFASSQYSAAYPASAVIDGDPTGAGWSNGGGWADGTPDQYPDWIEVDFPLPLAPGAQLPAIDHVVVYTLQDNWQNPSPPTDTMTFSQYGVTAFDVQVWNGSAWQSVGSVTGNNLVKRTVRFPAVRTSGIRIVVNAALNSLARITEIEAWTTGESNVGLAANGAAVSSSSQYSDAFPARAVIDGDPTGAGWSSGGGWADATPGQFPDWVQVSMPAQQWVDKVVVYTLQDNWQNPVVPTDTMTFTQYGITDFDVQFWDGTQWLTLASVTGNNLVKRTVTFNAVATTQIRVLVRNALNGYARITEIEVWGTPVSTVPTGTNWAAASNGGIASSSSQYSANYPVAAVIDGDRKGTNWSAGGGWADGTPDAYPDWVEVDFNGIKTLNTVTVYTVQDNWQNPSEPTSGMTFTQYGVTGFEVQAWGGTQWSTLGSVSGNNLVKRSLAVNFSTTKIRVNVTNAMSGLSRITEIEAWGN